ncbi:hypothetical protein [Methylorubrum podarium]|jgi:hypothetical protein|uniref:hypothetical protein n=1 Tax=Methylorubrum podarium TaxID=200476 RepID=UPI001EE199C0|nr:hypothetical protein [Methylorubrum podarium]MDV2982795.1 hypothetical protein [Methylobacteriaceae bacterium AG10]GJE71446.1 hypothetical protein CHKEEEPN_2992 [Methylorubrum podarium]
MPVPLDDLLQEIAPERRADIERNAAALVADFRRRQSEPAASLPPNDPAVGVKAATGQRCPQSGVWRVENGACATLPIAIGTTMPPHEKRAVTWILIQAA